MKIAEKLEQFDRALTAKELADMLNVSAVTIFKLAAKGRIPSFRIGTCVRFDGKRVAEWLRQQSLMCITPGELDADEFALFEQLTAADLI